MANKERLEVSIDAIDNFSKVFDNLNKRLAQLEKKQGKVEPKTVDNINTDMKRLEQQLGKLQQGQIVKMTGEQIKREIDDAIKQAKDLIAKADSALKNLASKTVNKGKNFNTAKKDFIEFYADDAVKELKKNKDLVIKAYATLDKKSVEKVQKEAQKTLDNKPVKQKVEVVQETKKSSPKDTKNTAESVVKDVKKEVKSTPVEVSSKADKKSAQKAGQEIAKTASQEVKPATETKSQQEIKVKATVDENSLRNSLNALVQKINQNPPIIKLLAKINSSGLLKELKDIANNANAPKVEVPLAVKFKGFAQELKEHLKNVQAKVPVGVSVDTKGLNKNIQETVKGVNITGVSVPLKVTSKGLAKAINDVLKETKISGVEVPVKINQDKFKSSIDSAKSKLNNLISTVYKIAVIINNDRLQKSVDSAEKKVTKFTGKDRKIKIDTDSRTIITKLQNIAGRVEALSKKTFSVNGDIKTANIESKIIRLATYINQLNSKDVKIKVDKGIENIVKLSTYMNQLHSKKISPDVEANITKAQQNVQTIKTALQELKKEKYKIQLDTSDLTGKNSQLKTTANTLKNLSNTLKTIKSRKVNLDFNAKNIGTVVRTMRNLNKELTNVKNNIVINIKVNDGDSIQKLREISRLLKEIKRNRNINVNTRTRGSSGGFGGGGSSQTSSGLLGSFLNGVTQFFGRSSKGFGSFLEAVARVNNNMIALGGTIGTVGIIISAIGATVSTVATAFNLTVSAVQTFGNVLMQVGQSIYSVLKPGIELYKQQQSALFSFTAALQSNGVLPNGQRLQDMGEDGRLISRGLSRELINRATLDAELSAFSLNDLLTSLQGTLPMLMQRGMSLDQAYEVNKGVAGVAKMIQLAPSQILQETRDLAQGSITARTSQVANALGITNEDLAQFQGNADALFDYMMQKFQNYSEMLNEFEDTAVGRFQQLEERWQTVSKNIVEGVAPQFKGLFETLIEMTGQWVDKSGAHLNALTGHWEDAEGNILDKVDEFGKTIQAYAPKEASFQLSDIFVEAKEALAEIVEYIAQTIDGLQRWMQEELGIVDPINDAKEILKIIIDLFSTSIVILSSMLAALWENQDVLFGMVKTVARFILILAEIPVNLNVIIGAFKYLWKVLVSIVEETGLWAKMLGQIVTGDWSGARNTFQDINNRTNNGIANATKEFMADMKGSAAVTSALMGDWNNINSFDDLQKIIGAGTTKGKFTEAINKYVGKIVDGSDKGDSKGVKPTDVRGVPNTSKEDEKARKNAIKESQKMLKEQLQRLKEALKDALGELKDILNKNKIAYDEGFMSIKDYFTQKAEIEAQEAELRLQEANDELKAIMNAQWDNDYDRDKELHRVNREIRQYTRELGNAKTSISEVNRAWKESINSLNSFTAFLTSNSVAIGKGVNNNQVMTSTVITDDFNSLMSFNPQTFEDKVAWAMKMAMQQGFDKEAAAGMVGNWIYESGGSLNPNAIGDNGTSYGIAQWHNERWDALREWASANNSDASDFRTQVLFALHEIISGREKGNYYANNGGVEQQVRNYMNNVERPADWAKVQSIGGRINYGEQAYKLADKQLVNLSNTITTLANNASSASSQIEGAASVLLSNSGELLGYTPSSQYSLGGIDTRYADFEDMSSGVETQINGMNDNVKQIINLINKMYYERTGGQKVIYTSFTGDLTGNTVNPHSSAEYGHQYGFKTDAKVRNEDVWVEIHKLLGVATRFENHHWDSSYGPGYTYTGGYGTDYFTGDAWWNKVQGAVSAGVREGGLGYVPGMSFQTQANTTETSHAFQQAMDKFNQQLMEYASKTEESILDIYNSDFFSGIKARVALIQQKWDKQLKELEVNMKNHPELKDSFNEAYSNYIRLMNEELEDTMVSYLEKRLNYNVDASETWGNYAAFETFSGRGMNPSEFLSKYQKYFYNDEKNPLAPSSVLSKMWDSVINYQNMGAVDKAQSLRQKILDTYDKLNTIFSNYMSYVNNYFDNYKTWLSNTNATNLQKEFGEREINARENEVKSNILGYQIQNNSAQLENYQKALDGIIERLKEIDKLQKDSGTSDEDKQKLEIERSKLIAQQDGLKLQKQKLEITNEELRVQKLLADQLKKQPTLLDDIRKTAKQALEDGLVNFLTDGIMQAESLGEALRNMAIDFLKTMQKMFAERMVKDLMNSLFPVKTELPTDASGQKQDPYAASTGYMSKFWFNNQGINPTQFYQPSTQLNPYRYPTLTNNNVGLGAFSNSWENSPLNKNRQYSLFDNNTQQKQTFFPMKETANSLDNLKNSANDAANTGIQPFTQNVTDASQKLQDIGTDTNINTSIETTTQTVATQIQNAGTTLSTQLETTGRLLITALNNIATQLQSIQFSIGGGASGASTGGFVYNNKVLKLASGGAVYHNSGLITGYGSSTSDDIPAMLSNGEAVLNAKAVKNLGLNFISAVNNGEFSKITANLPHFEKGGVISDAAQSTARGMTDFANSIGTNVSTTNQMNIALVRDEREAMEHFMRSPQGQRVLVDFQKGNGRVMSRFGR